MSKENLEEKEEQLHNAAEESESTDSNENNDSVQEEEAQETIELDPIEKLNAELKEQKDKFLRLYSEFENFRRRTAKEKMELVQTANAGLMEGLIPVVDDFERALQAFETAPDLDAAKEGVALVASKFKNTLEAKGLKVMDHEVGGTFDTDYHEAITQIPAPEEKLKGKIVDVIEKGYLLGDKVIRYAKVVTGQ